MRIIRKLQNKMLERFISVQDMIAIAIIVGVIIKIIQFKNKW